MGVFEDLVELVFEGEGDSLEIRLIELIELIEFILRATESVLFRFGFDHVNLVDVRLDDIADFVVHGFVLRNDDARFQIVVDNADEQLRGAHAFLRRQDRNDLRGHDHALAERLRVLLDHFEEEIFGANRTIGVALVVEIVHELVLDEVEHWLHVRLILLLEQLIRVVVQID